jgi:DNA-binding NtrC family response regulator
MVNRVLLVEDDSAIRFGVARHLERSGFVVAEADDCEGARQSFRTFDPHAIVTDLRLPDGEALEFIAEFRRLKPSLHIFVITGFGSIELAVRAVKTGADDLLTKPVDMSKLVDELRRVSQLATAPGPRRAVRPPPKPVALAEQVERLKDVECSVLILGETGTGKTKLVRALHEASRRRDRPFVDINCAGLARDLLESELFGHERGAFTSAHAAKAGMFELADGGTLFLDEIGDIDLAVQPKVLKAIEEKKFRRLGASREQSVDVRVVSATNRDLLEASRAGTFRADLYYRLSTITITIPPLRERRSEILTLAREILVSLSAKIGRSAPELSPDADAALLAYPWPGNIRELKNVLERALHLTRCETLFSDDVFLEESKSQPKVEAPVSLRESERAQLERALALYGHVGEAARSLGISRSSMYTKVKAYGLLPDRGSVPRMKTG